MIHYLVEKCLVISRNSNVAFYINAYFFIIQFAYEISHHFQRMKRIRMTESLKFNIPNIEWVRRKKNSVKHRWYHSLVRYSLNSFQLILLLCTTIQIGELPKPRKKKRKITKDLGKLIIYNETCSCVVDELILIQFHVYSLKHLINAVNMHFKRIKLVQYVFT